jgi:hypothetical protein
VMDAKKFKEPMHGEYLPHYLPSRRTLLLSLPAEILDVRPLEFSQWLIGELL